MKRILLIGLVLLFLVSCSTEVVNELDGIEGAEIPIECSFDQDNVCELFECMVDLCWCDDLTPEPILKEGTTEIYSEEEAVSYVEESLSELNEITGSNVIKVNSAVKLNGVFYNVFCEDENEDEVVYTLAVDGTIIKTTCGV